MMEKLIAKASEMSIGHSTSQSPMSGRYGNKRRQRADNLSGRHSDTSGAIRSDDDFSGIGYSCENLVSERIDAPPPQTTMAETSCSEQTHLTSTVIHGAVSPGAQILASLTAEALSDQSKLPETVAVGLFQRQKDTELDASSLEHAR